MYPYLNYSYLRRCKIYSYNLKSGILFLCLVCILVAMSRCKTLKLIIKKKNRFSPKNPIEHLLQLCSVVETFSKFHGTQFERSARRRRSPVNRRLGFRLGQNTVDRQSVRLHSSTPNSNMHFVSILVFSKAVLIITI